LPVLSAGHYLFISSNINTITINPRINMAIHLEANYSQKLGLPGYSSLKQPAVKADDVQRQFNGGNCRSRFGVRPWKLVIRRTSKMPTIECSTPPTASAQRCGTTHPGHSKKNFCDCQSPGKLEEFP